MATEQEEYQQYLKDMKDQEEYQQYLRETGQTAAQSQEETFSESAHPSGSPVDFMTRFKFKNILQNTDDKASEKWLKKTQPELDWKIVKGEPYYKKPGESSYYKMDPEGVDLQDITDIAGDVGAGLATTAATGLGFAGGAIGGLGFGGVPGAMAAGAAASGGIEAARQGLAKSMTGGEFQGLPVAINTVGGALSVPLFGAGATPAQVAKYAAAKGLSTQAAKQAEGGLLGRLLYGKPKVGEQLEMPIENMGQGVSSDIKPAPVMRQWSELEMRPETVRGRLGEPVNTGRMTHVPGKGTPREEIVPGVGPTGMKNVEEMPPGFQTTFGDLGEVTAPKPSLQQTPAQAAAAAAAAAEESWKTKGIIPSLLNMAATKAGSAISGVKERALIGYAKHKPVVDRMIGDPEGDLNYLRPRIQEINTAVDTARAQAGQELGQAIGNAQIKIDQTSILKPLYKRLSELENGPISGLKKNKEAIESLRAEIADITENVPKQADASTLFELQKYYGKEARWNMNPQAFDALPVPERQQINTFRSMYGAINDTLEAATGGISKDLKKKTKDLIELDKLTNKYFRDENSAASFFSGIDRQNNVLQRSTVERVKKLTNGAIDMSKDADIIAAYNIFKAPGIFPMSSQGSTSTGKILTMLSAGTAAAPFTNGVSLPIAALPVLAGPMAMKQYAKGANLASRGLNKIPVAARKVPPYLITNEALQQISPEILQMLFPKQEGQ